MTESIDYGHLLPSQVASLGRILASTPLNPHDFNWVSRDEMYGSGPQLMHSPSVFYFRFGEDEEHMTGKVLGHSVEFSPGSQRISEGYRKVTWSAVEQGFRRWLENLQREISAPTFLDVIHKHRAIAISGAAAEEEQPYPPEVQEGLRRELDAIAHELRGLNAGQANIEAHITAEIQELKVEVVRMRRGQWKKLLIGTIAKLAGNLLIPPGLAGQILDRIQLFIDALPPRLPTL